MTDALLIGVVIGSFISVAAITLYLIARAIKPKPAPASAPPVTEEFEIRDVLDAMGIEAEAVWPADGAIGPMPHRRRS